MERLWGVGPVTATRLRRLGIGTVGQVAATLTFLATARTLLRTALPTIRQRGLTLVGIAVTNLEEHRATQLMLPLHRGNGIDLDVAVDAIRRRFGRAAVTRGVLVGRDPGRTVPLLPE